MTRAAPLDQIKQMINLMGEGYSAGIIAQKMGVSRNAIIGRAYRMGLRWSSGTIIRKGRDDLWGNATQVVTKKKPAGTPRARYPRKQRNEPVKKIATPAMLAKAAKAHDDLLVHFEPGYLGQRGRVSIFDLKRNHCRYMVGEKFCGCKTHAGSSWCKTHYERVTATTEPIKWRHYRKVA